MKFSGRCGVDYSLPRDVYSGCAGCKAHTRWNWRWRCIFQIVRSRENHKKARKIIVCFPALKVCAICRYSTALVFEEIFAKTAFAVVSCAVPGLSVFYSLDFSISLPWVCVIPGAHLGSTVRIQWDIRADDFCSCEQWWFYAQKWEDWSFVHFRMRWNWIYYCQQIVACPSNKRSVKALKNWFQLIYPNLSWRQYCVLLPCVYDFKTFYVSGSWLQFSLYLHPCPATSQTFVQSLCNDSEAIIFRISALCPGGQTFLSEKQLQKFPNRIHSVKMI